MMPFPDYLRQATAQAHAKLELKPLLKHLFNAEATRSDYTCLLQVMYGFYRDHERAIQHFLVNYPSPLNDSKRWKTPWLQQDLQALIGHLPELDPMSVQISTLAEFVGEVYVLEGSTLGGQHIAGFLRQQHPDWPIRFFTGYGALTRQYWQMFWEAVADQCPPDAWPHAAERACWVFNDLAQRLAAKSLSQNSNN
ncbi:MAG: biliverdin-producing heme oxygenase [Methylococcales bacterium]|nr:biliverdin-producing heme oxygenase [Methylococcales bacterium]